MNEPAIPEQTPPASEATPAAQPEVELFQTPGDHQPDTGTDDDFTDPPILREIRPSFWDFCNKAND